MIQASIPSVEPRFVLPLFGARDQHLRRLRERFKVDITHRDGEIRVTGDEPAVSQVTQILETLTSIVRERGNLTPDLFDQTIAHVTGDEFPVRVPPVDILQAGRQVRPKTIGQAKYVDAIRNFDLVFAVGPAGTGKTYLAVAAAVEALKHQAIRKIVLVRPAVEAGESLGYLPGDMQAKINPYLRPLMDAINEMIGFDHGQRLIQQDVIEVIPLAYMRGRTLNDAFIILDEAQNTSIAQMKMFLDPDGAEFQDCGFRRPDASRFADQSKERFGRCNLSTAFDRWNQGDRADPRGHCPQSTGAKHRRCLRRSDQRVFGGGR